MRYLMIVVALALFGCSPSATEPEPEAPSFTHAGPPPTCPPGQRPYGQYVVVGRTLHLIGWACGPA